MKHTCVHCISDYREANLKEISAVHDSHIYVCKACGAFWQKAGGKWELLLSAEQRFPTMNTVQHVA